MAYRVFAKDIAAPFSHMIFYSLAHISRQAEKLIGVKAKPPLAARVKKKNFSRYSDKELKNIKRLSESID